MLKCDGFKMFHGTVQVTPCVRPDGTRWRDPFDLTGTWLFKPAWSFGSGATEGCWYCQKDSGGFAESYPVDILSDFRDDAG
jgi:hypothetical protein